VQARPDLPGGLVTLVFAEVEDAARLAQVLGAAYRPMLTEYRRVLRRALPGHGAAEVSVMGDCCLFAFAEAAAALHGCVAVQALLSGVGWPAGMPRPGVRMGMHTALIEPIDGEYVGLEVVRAARVAGAARGGQALCSGATACGVPVHIRRTLLVDLGLRRLRDFAEPLRLFQLAGPAQRYGTSGGHGSGAPDPRRVRDRRTGGGGAVQSADRPTAVHLPLHGGDAPQAHLRQV
jgi:class 3 adenylate cyclase